MEEKLSPGDNIDTMPDRSDMPSFTNDDRIPYFILFHQNNQMPDLIESSTDSYIGN